jgi:hypothetical protein
VIRAGGIAEVRKPPTFDEMRRAIVADTLDMVILTRRGRWGLVRERTAAPVNRELVDGDMLIPHVADLTVAERSILLPLGSRHDEHGTSRDDRCS